MTWSFHDAYGQVRTTDPAGRGVVYSDTPPTRTDVIWVDTSDTGAIKRVSSLPSNPYDGQEVSYQTADMLVNGFAWHLRYNASGNTYKWEYLGGPPYGVNVDANENYSSNVFGNLTTAENLVVPLSGLYVVTYGAGISSGSGTSTAGLYSPSGAGVTASDAHAARMDFNTTYGNGMSAHVSRTRNIVLTPGTLRMQARSSGSSLLGFANRFLYIQPVSVS